MNNILKGIAGVGLILYPFFVAYALAHGQYVWVSAVLIPQPWQGCALPTELFPRIEQFL